MKKTSLVILNFISGVFVSLAQVISSPGNTGTQTTSAGTSLFGRNNPIAQLITLVKTIADRLIPILVAFAILAFFWFLVRFIWKGAEDPGEREKMKGGMGWSIVAIFVMVSVWGIIGFIGSITGIPQGGNIHGFKLPGAQ